MFNEDRINITAHAGCMETEMDSIESIEAGIRYGANIVEVDLNIDENENLVLCHDEPKLWEKYIYFEEALGVIKDKKDILMNIDVKNDKTLKKLNSIILDYNMESRVFFTGLSFSNIIDNREELKKSNYFLNLDLSKFSTIKLYKKKYLSELCNEFKILNIMGMNINYRFATPELIDACKEKGLLCSVWTVDDVIEMKKMIDLKVNSITTKRVDILKSTLYSRNKLIYSSSR